MTKRKTDSSKEESEKAAPLVQYVILKRVLYKAMIPQEFELIKPAADPFAPDAPRRPFEHLGKVDINRLLMRRIIAEDKVEVGE